MVRYPSRFDNLIPKDMAIPLRLGIEPLSIEERAKELTTGGVNPLFLGTQWHQCATYGVRWGSLSHKRENGGCPTSD